MINLHIGKSVWASSYSIVPAKIIGSWWRSQHFWVNFEFPQIFDMWWNLTMLNCSSRNETYHVTCYLASFTSLRYLLSSDSFLSIARYDHLNKFSCNSDNMCKILGILKPLKSLLLALNWLGFYRMKLPNWHWPRHTQHGQTKQKKMQLEIQSMLLWVNLEKSYFLRSWLYKLFFNYLIGQFRNTW